jgi:tetratricopeptide (TPR) repeat protein
VRSRSLLFATLIVAASNVLIQAQTNQAEAILKRGEAFVVQAKYKDAIEEYSKVSTRAGESHVRAVYNIGVCYYELWKTDEAISFYKRAIELKQGNYPKASYALGIAHRAASHNNLGVMLAQLGMLKDAEAEFVMALKRSAGTLDDAALNLKLCRSLINQGTELTGFRRINFILKNPVIM